LTFTRRADEEWSGNDRPLLVRIGKNRMRMPETEVQIHRKMLRRILLLSGWHQCSAEVSKRIWAPANCRHQREAGGPTTSFWSRLYQCTCRTHYHCAPWTEISRAPAK